ncbi:MAG: lysophospholipid acyltransferase family protein [Candidatus Latescibacterota bacterium]|nr:MAG: lysophospholipid acyltransferase family protein [Candidatus Latescibacterota bacterium]
MIGAFFYKLAGFLSSFLPQRLSEAITAMLARAQYYINTRSRENVIENLGVVLGPDTSERVLRRRAKNVFTNFASSIYCFVRLPYIDRDELKRRCDFNGIDRVAFELLERGGFILAGPHVGPWEIAGRCLSDLGVPIHTVALDHPTASVTKFFDQRRRSMGMVCYPISGSFKPLQTALKAGKCVALLIDRNYGRARRRDPLFGCEVPLPSSHCALAVRCGVPILTAVIVFDGNCRFKFVFNGPHYPDKSLEERVAMEQLQERCRADMEAFIRDYPEQWFNFESLKRVST